MRPGLGELLKCLIPFGVGGHRDLDLDTTVGGGRQGADYDRIAHLLVLDGQRVLGALDDRQDRALCVGRRPYEIGSVGGSDRGASEVGVEGRDDRRYIGPDPVDHDEVAGVGVVGLDKVQGHDHRARVVDRQSLLVVGRAGGCPVDVHAVGGQVVVGGGVSGLLQVLVEKHAHVHAAVSVGGQIRLRGRVVELVHGEVNTSSARS